jgi:hypothetical protein
VDLRIYGATTPVALRLKAEQLRKNHHTGRRAAPTMEPEPESKTGTTSPDDPQQSSEERIQWLRDHGVTV